MKYNEFNNIVIEDGIGVSPVGQDTKKIAKKAGTLQFKHAIDIGTGTGFIAIYLRTLGFDVEGTDINPLSVKLANKNAQLNNVDVPFFVSNLFSEVKKKYDLIIFATPEGNTNSVFLSYPLEIIKSFIPKESFIPKLIFPLIRKKRMKLIRAFLSDAPQFLQENGRILMYLYDHELDLIPHMHYEELDALNHLKLVLISMDKSG